MTPLEQIQQYPKVETPTIPRLTKEQAAILGAYSGICFGPFGDIQAYAERVLGRPIFTHEFANDALCEELKQAASADFNAICYEVQQ